MAQIKASIVGSSFYNGAGNIIARLRPGASLRLLREPDNKYDKNAIAVYYSNTKLGHISAGLASLMAPRMDAGTEVKCNKHPAIGGVIWLSWDEAMAPADAPAIKVDAEGDDIMKRFRGLGI